MLPTLAVLGDRLPDAFIESVTQVVALFKDGMLLILGFYFRGALGGDVASRSG